MCVMDAVVDPVMHYVLDRHAPAHEELVLPLRWWEAVRTLPALLCLLRPRTHYDRADRRRR